MPRNSNQQPVDSYQGSALPGPAAPNSIQSAQEQIYDANAAAARDILVARPQKAFWTANDALFQPNQNHDAARGVSLGSSPEYFGVAGGTAAGAQGDTRSTLLVGDLVTGGPRGGEAFRDTVVDLGADLATGGEPGGPQSDNQPGAQDFYRSVSDYPGGKGSGTTAIEPTGYDNPA